nr:MAG TPA: hypothetical protein [Caudoviricetes sp.]
MKFFIKNVLFTIPNWLPIRRQQENKPSERGRENEA